MTIAKFYFRNAFLLLSSDVSTKEVLGKLLFEELKLFLSLMHEYLLDFQFLTWFLNAFNNLARLNYDFRSDSLTIFIYTYSFELVYS